jgi:hypothetical protein
MIETVPADQALFSLRPSGRSAHDTTVSAANTSGTTL